MTIYTDISFKTKAPAETYNHSTVSTLWSNNYLNKHDQLIS